MKKRLFTICILCLFCTLLLAGCSNKEQESSKENQDYNSGNSNFENSDSENYLSGKHYVQIDVESFGTIIAELDADAAPATVTNFVNLVQESFYNGLTFHRIINGFMMQGGDPEGTGMGGSETTIPGEFALNGYQNPISHVRGTLSMARSSDYNSASSQFFIVQQDAVGLDGSYAAFGKVLYGMEVVDDICTHAVVEDENGTVPALSQPVISSIILLGEEAIEMMKQQELANLPDPEAEITVAAVSSTEGLDLVDSWNIHEDGETYLLFSSLELLSIGIYETDLSSGIEYDPASPLGYYADIAANEYITVKLNIIAEELPTLLLVAEEHSGAIGQYLLCYDDYFGGIYLVPVLN